MVEILDKCTEGKITKGKKKEGIKVDDDDIATRQIGLVVRQVGGNATGG